MKLPTLRPSLPLFDLRTVKGPEKKADQFYSTPEYRAWRELVIRRADGRCEYRGESGMPCGRAERRMFANHIVEVRDDPSRRLDPSNGNCLCGRHHTLWTNQQREARHARHDGSQRG